MGLVPVYEAIDASRTITTASQQVLNANPWRVWAVLQNQDEFNDIYLKLGNEAATITSGIQLKPGGSVIFYGKGTKTAKPLDAPIAIWDGSIQAIATASTPYLLVTEVSER